MYTYANINRQLLCPSKTQSNIEYTKEIHAIIISINEKR